MNLRFVGICSMVCVLQLQFMPVSRAQQPATSSKAEATLSQSMKDGKYTFILFYKQNDDATNAMAKTIKDGLADKTDKAAATSIRVGDTTEQALISKYDVSRAPMPLTVVVAPNGAMTGMFAQRLTPEKLNEAFVTPTMMTAMKSLQEGKLVLITVQGSVKTAAPRAIKDFQADPHFKDRLVTLEMTAADPNETKFIGQVQIEARVQETQTVLLAPPGVMVGKFNALTSQADIAAALARAGKCCDDPNCKHHQHATGTTTQSRR